ncbi:YgdI/YgdR family lipoprotein [Pseudodesulfovibrio senegalensis]|uniref:YgdI/YgdR family lipoprotein n=1 Tax=Pseudodesulfovibrio senegalensis TaxID=1721087 RepID=A0A6N6N1K7_9BACT|nr:YgdI/YgdR family lipoprotein [Pseudodesulfovibrio senegalensis]KAB1438978.1 YgdI/YgdR family lipoprotein [Pseudodesulfovibrio senegalensis]
MKTLCTTLLLCLFLLAATGCGSKSYQVKTTDGDVYTTSEQPEYDKKSQTYSFENEKGMAVTIKREDLKVIEEVK